jgi:hypothetical protein
MKGTESEWKGKNDRKEKDGERHGKEDGMNGRGKKREGKWNMGWKETGRPSNPSRAKGRNGDGTVNQLWGADGPILGLPASKFIRRRWVRDDLG